MISKISFGSTFNPEKTFKKGLENPDHDVETLERQEAEPHKALAQFPQENLGRSQVKITLASKPLSLAPEIRQFLSKLSSKEYGFAPDSDKFYTRSRKKNEDGSFSMIMGDGKLQDGTLREDFVVGLIDENTKAIHISSKSVIDGKKESTMFIYDEDTNSIHIRSTDFLNGASLNLEHVSLDKVREEIKNIFLYDRTVQGVTIWE